MIQSAINFLIKISLTQPINASRDLVNEIFGVGKVEEFVKCCRAKKNDTGKQ